MENVAPIFYLLLIMLHLQIKIYDVAVYYINMVISLITVMVIQFITFMVTFYCIYGKTLGPHAKRLVNLNIYFK